MIHSADLHGGLGTHDFPLPGSLSTMREAEFIAVLAELLEHAKADPDKTLVLLGDVFNSRRPPAWAYAAFENFLIECEMAGVTVIAFRGNHDGCWNGQAEPMHAFSGNSALRYVGTPLIVRVGTTALVIIPWFSRMGIAQNAPCATVDEQHQMMREHLSKLVADLVAVAVKQSSTVAVCLHSSISGSTFASETQPVLGTTSEFIAPYKAFDIPGVDAVFAGHVHKPQEFGGGVRVFYPGSPVHTDFGDPMPRKCLSYVDGDLTWLPLTAATPLVTLPLVTAEDGSLLVQVTAPVSMSGTIVRMKGEAPHTAANAARVLELQQGLVQTALRAEKPAITWQRGVTAGGASISVNTDPTAALETYLEQTDDEVRSRTASVMKMHAQLLEEVR
jgi:exonuclease SbcD